MKRNLRILAAIVLGTILGMMWSGLGPLGSRVYPPHEGPDVVDPVGLQAPVLALGMLAQAVGLGIALALLVERRAIVAALTRLAQGRRGVAIGALAGLVWGLGSWIPHVSLHLHIDPRDLWALAAIEWGFHVSVVAGAALIARYLFVVADASASPRARAEGAHATADA